MGGVFKYQCKIRDGGVKHSHLGRSTKTKRDQAGRHLSLNTLAVASWHQAINWRASPSQVALSICEED